MVQEESPEVVIRKASPSHRCPILRLLPSLLLPLSMPMSGIRELQYTLLARFMGQAAKGGADRTIIVAAVVVIRREVVVPAEAGAALEEMALLLSPTVVQTMTVAVARWILFLLLLRIGEEGEGKEEVDIAVEAVLVAALGAGVVVEDNRAIEDGGEEEEEEEEGEDEVLGMALRTPPLLRLSQAFIPWQPISR